MANSTHSASAFGAFGQALLPERTGLTICSEAKVDGALGLRIFTRGLRSARGLIRLGSAASRFLAIRRHLLPNAPWLVRTLPPTATIHTLLVGFAQPRERKAILSGVPTRYRAAQFPASFAQARGADSTPIEI